MRDVTPRGFFALWLMVRIEGKGVPAPLKWRTLVGLAALYPWAWPPDDIAWWHVSADALSTMPTHRLEELGYA